jgi:hypothetical protein
MRYLLLSTLLLLTACSLFGPKEYEQNPDPNHTHADFALYIEEEKIDFAIPEYMSGVSYNEESHDEEHEYHHEYLHLHDDVGHVIHTHKQGLTVGTFFSSIGFVITANCIQLDSGVDVCPERDYAWHMYIRKKPLNKDEVWQEIDLTPDYIFDDMDQILLTYQSSDPVSNLRIIKQQEEMTDDACLYSQTCPWKGDPPTENCIADPEIPCVLPLE